MVLAALCAVVGLLSVLPMGRLLLEGFVLDGRASTAALTRVLSAPVTWVAAWHTVETAIGGTILAGLLGGAMALLVTFADLRGRSALVFGFILPLVIPPHVTALAWLQMFGPSSPLLGMLGVAPPVGTRNPLYSRGGIILLLGVHYAPLVFLALRAGARQLPRDLVEAAHAAGGTRRQVLATVIVPLMRPPLLAGVVLTFVSCVGNFGIPALLGVPGNYTVLTTLIYQRLAGLGTSVLADVSALSIVIGLFAVSGLLVQNWMHRRGDYQIAGVSPGPLPYDLGRWRRLVEGACWVVIGVVVVLPLTALVSTSLVPAYGVKLGTETATLESYAYVMFGHDATGRAFINSFVLAAGAALAIVAVSVPLGYFLVWRRLALLHVLNLVVELPYALPGVVLAIASILIFLKPLPLIGLSVYNTVWIILIAYLARFLTLGLRPVVSGYQQLDRALDEAAQMSGAGLIFRLGTIVLPLVAPTAVAGALLVFLMAFNELTVSALLWSSGAETLGVVVFGLEQGGESTYAAAVAVLTIAVTLLLMMAASLVARWLPAGVIPWRA